MNGIACVTDFWRSEPKTVNFSVLLISSVDDKRPMAQIDSKTTLHIYAVWQDFMMLFPVEPYFKKTQKNNPETEI